jgi:peroxiredoxin
MSFVNRAAVVWSIAVLAVAALSPKGWSKQGDAPKAAPEFSAIGTDGNNYTLAKLASDRPVVLYFIKIGCPVNARAIPHFNNLASAYGDKAVLVGVIDGSVSDARDWKKENAAPYLILADQDEKIIHAYGAQASPHVALVKDGKIVGDYASDWPKSLGAVNSFMATAAKANGAKLDFSTAPAGHG